MVLLFFFWFPQQRRLMQPTLPNYAYSFPCAASSLLMYCSRPSASIILFNFPRLFIYLPLSRKACFIYNRGCSETKKRLEICNRKKGIHTKLHWPCLFDRCGCISIHLSEIVVPNIHFCVYRCGWQGSIGGDVAITHPQLGNSRP